MDGDFDFQGSKKIHMVQVKKLQIIVVHALLSAVF